MDRRRFEYLLKLGDFNERFAPDPVTGVTWRHPSIEDQQILAHLMLDSYHGTIDYDGETIDDAINEIRSYFSEPFDPEWLEFSWLAFIHNQLVCASLVSFGQKRNAPIIAYIMTDPHWKGRHLATVAIARTLRELWGKNYEEVWAVITEGNLPSEKIFTALGFARLIPG